MDQQNRSYEQLTALELFKKYVETTTQFCKFLYEHEGIDARGLFGSQSEFVQQRFLSLPKDRQLLKFRSFESYFELCREITAGRHSLKEKVFCLRAFLSKHALRLPDQNEVFGAIDENTYIEVYDRQFTQVYRSADFLKITGHSLMALETCEFPELFERSKDLSADQAEVVTKIFDGTIKYPVFKPIEDHSVKEINSDHPRCSQAEIIAYSPIYGDDDTFHGALHLFRVTETRSLNFRVV